MSEREYSGQRELHGRGTEGSVRMYYLRKGRSSILLKQEGSGRV